MPKPQGKLGSGSRFRALKAQVAKNPKVKNPRAVAAAIGRKKYGAKKFASLGRKGKKAAGMEKPRLMLHQKVARGLPPTM